VEKRRTEVVITDTNTTTLTPPPAPSQRGPESAVQPSQEPTAIGPGQQIERRSQKNEDLGKFNMTSISSLQVSPDIMDHTAFHAYGLHDDKFDAPSAFPNASTFEFPAFPDPPPLAAGNPLFDEKETAFMSSFFDTVDQNTSFDHDFQDGLAQWTVPGLDIRKGFEDVWNGQSNMQNGNNVHYTAAPTPTTVYGLPHYEPTPDANYGVAPLSKQHQAQPLTQNPPQPYNPQNFLSHVPNSSHANDLARNIFIHRNPHPHPSQCDPMYPNYPSLSIPVGSPSGIASSNHTPTTTPKVPTYTFLKNELSGSESPPTISASRMPPVPRSAQSTYATSSTSSSSPQPGPSKPPRKKRRENLSEAQKRLNHITSEQKRRNLIQQGFNEIHSLVPSLRSQRDRGDSKSAVLLKTVEYVLELQAGNERLRRMLKR
jgi:hypothetical protein